jgi:hypothetical protein
MLGSSLTVNKSLFEAAFSPVILPSSAEEATIWSGIVNMIFPRVDWLSHKTTDNHQEYMYIELVIFFSRLLMTVLRPTRELSTKISKRKKTMLSDHGKRKFHAIAR